MDTRIARLSAVAAFLWRSCQVVNGGIQYGSVRGTVLLTVPLGACRHMLVNPAGSETIRGGTWGADLKFGGSAGGAYRRCIWVWVRNLR
jgi:hypothetical protein